MVKSVNIIAPSGASVQLEHLIILAHGIDGDTSDLKAVRDEILLQANKGVEVFQTDVNCNSRTHAGVRRCCDRIWEVLLPRLKALCAASTKRLRVSFIGHSFGGLCLRCLATKLFVSDLRDSVLLDTLVCIASPHLGCRLLGRGGKGGVAPLMVTFGPSIMRAGLRLIKGRTGPELLLDNDSLETLSDGDNCDALRAFRRRIAYCNGCGDWLVNVESASLLAAEELAAVLPPSAAACQRPEARVIWRPSEETTSASSSWPPTLALSPEAEESAGGGGQRTLVLRPLPRTWDSSETVRSHSTWDDRQATRGRRAAAILQQLRSCGDWELHLCHFLPKRSSFAGGVFSPHIDLVAHPKCTQRYGLEVVRHLAARMVEGSPKDRL